MVTPGIAVQIIEAASDARITRSEFQGVVDSLAGVIIWGFGLAFLGMMIKSTYRGNSGYESNPSNPGNPKPIAHILTVPGGSRWSCTACQRKLLPGEQVTRIGSDIYCPECIRKGVTKQPKSSNPGNLNHAPDVDTLISSKTASMVANLRNDSRFVGMHDYLQSYAELATLGTDYPDHLVDRLFNRSETLADKARSILKWEPDPHKYNMSDPTDMAKYEKDKNTLKAKKAMEDSFLRAYTRADKVAAIDSLVHLEHVTGTLLPELFGFSMMHEPTIAYSNEIISRLAEK